MDNAAWVALAGLIAFAAPVGAQLAWTDADGALTLSDGNTPVLTYHVEPVPAPEGEDPAFARGAYIHPLCDTLGREVTGDFPAGHAHHRGLFLTWSGAAVGDTPVNFWELQERTGRVVCVGVDEAAVGENGATLRVRHELQYAVDDAWQPALAETMTYTILPAAPGDPRIVDISSQQTCVTDEPVTITQKNYGGMAFRGPDRWEEELADVWVLTSSGDARDTANETRPNWQTMSGPVDDGRASVTSMDHPSNPRHPTPVRIHPTMPFMCAMLAQKEPFVLLPGDTLTQRFRVLVHPYDPTPDELAEAWESYLGEG